ncbi:MAG: N-acetyl-gamma-glutamyl-phosphate reductase [Clostridiales bacterium]|nr:N-acetyl-gamma-glutamyl-phosphate reductase [Clostridiales bacterium]
MKKVFIDGSAGTTGLRIFDRLDNRDDIELITLPEELRKDSAARKCAINMSDVSFFCLPDSASVEAAGFVENPDTVIIDTSTAHRTNDGWTYGFPELSGYREKIRHSKRIANPGCHASGFIALVQPLVSAGLIAKDAALSCFSLTGYSGGGKKMIASYEDGNCPEQLSSPGMYGLSQAHKHLPEMQKICFLENAPSFCPVVAPYYSGMQVTVPLFKTDINSVCEVYSNTYKTGLIHFNGIVNEGTLYAADLKNKDIMEVVVCGNSDRLLLVSRFDNLGKGASGAAIQNMNIVLGCKEDKGLSV